MIWSARTARAAAACRKGRTGSILLEVVLALAIFVAAGTAILSSLAQAGDSLVALRERVKAADLARSAMARLEAGLADPIALNGPERPWEDDEAAGSGRFESSPPRGDGWELKIQTEPSEFDGLTRVTVTARRESDADRRSAGAGGSYTLRQLVRLSGRNQAAADGASGTGKGAG